MPFIETNLAVFVALVIPGIIGMLVYKPFVDRGDDNEHYQYDLMIALMIGTLGYIAAGLTGYAGATFKIEFMTQTAVMTAVSVITCVLVGGLAGWYNRIKMPLTFLPAFLHSKHSGHSIQVPENHGLCRYLKDMKYSRDDCDELVAIVKIYKLGEPEKYEIGALCFESNKGDELELFTTKNLSATYLDDNDGDDGEVEAHTRFVNLSNGIVTEVGLVNRKYFE